MRSRSGRRALALPVNGVKLGIEGARKRLRGEWPQRGGAWRRKKRMRRA